MMKRHLSVVVSVGFALAGTGTAECEPVSTPTVVAVFPIVIQDVKGVGRAQVDKFTSLLDTVTAGSGYQTVPQADIRSRLMEQQKDSYKECYDESCQIQLGKAVAAQKALSTTWAAYGESCVLSVKLYDLKSEVAEFSTKADATCDEAGLRNAIEDVGSALKARNQEGYGAFKLDLNAGRDIKNPPTDKTGYLSVSAEAKGRPNEKIEVYINGDLAGTTPFQKEFPVGQYVVILRTAGDRFAHKRFDIRLGTDGVRIPKEGREQLLPVFGAIVIEGSPSQATALINGEPRALNGALHEERRVGTYKIVVEAPGYLPSAAQEVRIVPGGEVRVSYGLVRNAGSIAIVGAPAGAEVLLDHVSRGEVPVTLSDVDIGDHVIEVQALGYRPERKVAAVKRGETAKISVNLKEMRARLKIEAVARITGDEIPVEADVFIDSTKVGTTPWKGEVLAEMPHTIELRLGSNSGPKQTVTLPEGREQREVIEVPGEWGGAVSSVRFRVVDGPWEIRSGPAVLKIHAANPVRPGRVPIDFFLAGKKVGEANVSLSPNENKIITITQRPRTEEELSSSRSAWTWRRWVSLGATVVATGFGVERNLAAHRAQDQRDEAFSALRSADDATAFDDYRQRVVRDEQSRSTAQVLSFGLFGVAGAFGLWSTIEWFFSEPDAGRVRGDGIEAVEAR